MKKLLTIGIPTFNRANDLKICLHSICEQLSEFWDVVDVLVSNNCSTDNTDEIISSYQEIYPQIIYNKNIQNLGVDKNLQWLFLNSKNKYLWIIGDDDVILDDKLKMIIKYLKLYNPAIMYINGYSFENDYKKEYPKRKSLFEKNEFTLMSRTKFVKSVNYLLTFCTGNIINTELIDNDIDITANQGSHLSQTYWYFHVLMNGDIFIRINDYFIAAKKGNTGGYKVFHVFSNNFNRLMDYFIINKKMPKRFKKIINFNLLLSFFPPYILLFRVSKAHKFMNENPKEVLNNIYKSNFWFYVFLFPIFHLPITLAAFFHKVILNSLNRVVK